MNVSAKLVRTSRIMAALAGIGAAIYLAMEILLFAAPNIANAFSAVSIHGNLPLIGAPLANRLGALAFDLIPGALVVWALLELRRLFLFYARGEVFSEGALRALNRVAALMFIEVLAAFVVQAPQTYILSLANPPGQRSMSLGLGSNDLAFLFMAGVVLVIARVMAEARRVSEENASFV